MKKIIGNLVVGASVIVGVSWYTLSVVELINISENTIDNKNKITHNTTYDIGNYNHGRDILGANAYYEIKKGAEERRLKEIEEYEKMLAEKAEQERLERVRLEELEKKRLARQKEKEKQVATISRGAVQDYDSDWMTFEATNYTPYCTGCSGVTAVGLDVRKSIYYNNYRIIATDPKVIPMWSLVEVVTPYETFKAVAADTGGAIKGSKIDILVATKEEAYRLGRFNAKVRIIAKK